MKTSYDPTVDALTIRLADIAIDASQEVAPNVILDFDAEGRVVGLELLPRQPHRRPRPPPPRRRITNRGRRKAPPFFDGKNREDASVADFGYSP